MSEPVIVWPFQVELDATRGDREANMRIRRGGHVGVEPIAAGADIR
jgi:hypothetical protein